MPADGSGQESSVLDDMGRLVAVEGAPQRVVSLVSGWTEVLVGLGLTDRLAGATSHDGAAPAEVRRVGSTTDVDLAAVLALAPDLVLAGGGEHDQLVTDLDRAGIPVFALRLDDLGGVARAVRVIGQLVGRQEAAAQWAADLARRLAAVVQSVRRVPLSGRPVVLGLLWDDPLVAAGVGSWLHRLLVAAGATNALGAGGVTPVVRCDVAAAAAANPDMVVCADQPTHELVTRAREWAQLRAVRRGRVHPLAMAGWRAGPSLLDGLEHLVRMIHPSLFPSDEPVPGR